MGHKVESFQSNDGVLFGSEEAMLIHEATVDLSEEFPQLKVQVPFIMSNAARIAAILSPIHVFATRQAAPEVVEQRRREFSAAGQEFPSKPSDTPRMPCPGSRYTGPKSVVTPLIRDTNPATAVAGAGVGCKAAQFSDQMQCEGCNLVWDVNDGYTPYCKPEVYQNG